MGLNAGLPGLLLLLLLRVSFPGLGFDYLFCLYHSIVLSIPFLKFVFNYSNMIRCPSVAEATAASAMVTIHRAASGEINIGDSSNTASTKSSTSSCQASTSGTGKYTSLVVEILSTFGSSSRNYSAPRLPTKRRLPPPGCDKPRA